MRRTLFTRLSGSAALAAILAGSGCMHSTRLAATWRDPSAQPLHFRKPITVFVTKSETLRRTMEDKLAAQFPGAVPSYKVFGSKEITDGAAIRRGLAESGFDGAIIMRVASVDERITYTPGSYWYGPPYYSFAGYWGNAWGYPYDPGYVSEDRIVSIETQIYNLNNDKLIWAARSETTNPQSVGRLGDSVIRHVMEGLRKDGLVLSYAPERTTTTQASGS